MILFAKLLLAVLFTIFSVIINFTSFFKSYSERVRINKPKAILWAGFLFDHILDIRTIVLNSENIPKSEMGYISISNHQSMIDILLILRGVGRMFLMKSAMIWTPFGWGGYIAGGVMVNRDKASGQLKVINRIIAISKNVAALHIFPEGTRSVNGEIAKFRVGSLKMIYRAKLSVLPSGIWGPHLILSKNSVKLNNQYPAVLTIGKLINPADYENAELFVSSLEEKVHELVEVSRKFFNEEVKIMDNKKNKQKEPSTIHNKTKDFVDSSKSLAKEGIDETAKLGNQGKNLLVEQVVKIKKFFSWGKDYAKEHSPDVQNLAGDAKDALKVKLTQVQDIAAKGGSIIKDKAGKVSDEGKKIFKETLTEASKLTEEGKEAFKGQFPEASKLAEEGKVIIKDQLKNVKNATAKSGDYILNKTDNAQKLAAKFINKASAGIKDIGQQVTNSEHNPAKQNKSAAQGKSAIVKSSPSSSSSANKQLAKSDTIISAQSDDIRGEYQMVMKTPIGNLYLQATKSKITHLLFKEPAEKFKAGAKLPILVKAQEQLESYFKGDLQKFDLELDMAGTPMQKKIWAALQKVPYGKTTSYKELGLKIKPSTTGRVIGNAMGKNPIPIIVPCHRVIGSDGDLCGYGGGLSTKKRLLKIEQA